MTTYSAKNWINGAFVSSASLSISINPATYERIGDYPDDGGAAAGSAIDAASRAFRGTAWAHDIETRAKVLDQMALAIERNRDPLIDILSLENGKVRGEAALEVDGAPSKLRYWAAMARTEAGRAVQPRPGSLSIVLRQPMGVAGVIVPWNSPIILAARSFAPALAAGCTVVIRCQGRPPRSLACWRRFLQKPRTFRTASSTFSLKADRMGPRSLSKAPTCRRSASREARRRALRSARSGRAE